MRVIYFLFSLLVFIAFSEVSFAQNLTFSEEIKVSQNHYDDEEEFEDFSDFSFDVTPKNEVYDPFERMNRKIFIFNDFVDRYVFEHIAIGYQKSVPRVIRKSIRNFFNNLSAPFSVINSLLQGNVENAMASFSSFLINTTIGIGGIFNVAGDKDVRYHKEDLGQTFAVYGINSGPYIIIPFFGPSNLRDATGMASQAAVDPLSINIFNVGDDELVDSGVLMGLNVVSVIDKRESLLKIIDDLRNNSFDLYITVRSAYTQNRYSKIINENKL